MYRFFYLLTLRFCFISSAATEEFEKKRGQDIPVDLQQLVQPARSPPSLLYRFVGAFPGTWTVKLMEFTHALGLGILTSVLTPALPASEVVSAAIIICAELFLTFTSIVH